MYTQKRSVYLHKKRRNARQRNCRRAAQTDGKQTFCEKSLCSPIPITVCRGTCNERGARSSPRKRQAAAGSAADFLCYTLFFRDYSFPVQLPGYKQENSMAQFADEAVIEVRSGKGGNGCIAFRREKYIPRGGPNGGDGGKGGDVVFCVKRNMRTLAKLRNQVVFKAKNGGDGSGWNKYGKDGEDVVIAVPPGTTIRDAETDELIHDFTDEDENERFVFLSGGKGGWGNVHFKSSTNQAPRYAHPGTPGEVRKLRLELSIIADAGLVGFPNAGKSSLLNAFTNARPKIAPYPFTTKIPNLGVLRVDGERDIIIADIPGILEGASEGVGLGIRFLKHIARTAGLAFLIDLSDENYLTAYDTLSKELAAYSEELAAKKRIIIATKLDIEGTKERLKTLQKQYPDVVVLGISVFNRWGLDEVRDAFVALVEALSGADSSGAVIDQNAVSASASGKAKTVVQSADANSFMYAELEDPVYEMQEGFGATVSLSRKRRGKK